MINKEELKDAEILAYCEMEGHIEPNGYRERFYEMAKEYHISESIQESVSRINMASEKSIKNLPD